jgi:hypothetical protein
VSKEKIEFTKPKQSFSSKDEILSFLDFDSIDDVADSDYFRS